MRVLLTVHANLDQIQDISGGLTFHPYFVSGNAPKRGDFFLQRVFQGRSIDMSYEQNCFRVNILNGHRNDPDA